MQNANTKATATAVPEVTAKPAALSRAPQSGSKAAGAAKSGEAKPKSLFSSIGSPSMRPISKGEQIKLFRGLASMLKAQLNTADAIKFYAHGLPNKDLAAVLVNIRDNVTAGMPVHEAFRKTGRFDEMAIGLIQAGADSSRLEEAFSALAARLKSDQHFRALVRKAVLMPSIVICILIGALILSQTQIVPQVEDMLLSVGAEPDPFTRITFAISHFVQSYWIYFVITAIICALVVWRSSSVRNAILNLTMAKWRLVSQLVMGLRQLTVFGTLHMLYSNGINLAKAIRTSAESVRGTPLREEMLEAADRYQHAALPASEAFSKYTSCDPQVSHMMGIGERTASIDIQLKLLAEMYEEDTQAHMENFIQKINLVIIIVAALLIAFVFISAFLPIFLMGPRLMRSAM